MRLDERLAKAFLGFVKRKNLSLGKTGGALRQLPASLTSEGHRSRMQSRVYGRVTEIVPVPNLKDLQVKSYRRFLQLDRPAHKRENVGLEAILREIFPIESFDKQLAI